ncbi:MAG: ABC-type transport auxiliary lipoprotein family protein [Sulfuricurvum sp.]|nr:ABC-type transport auxiliary lipoprotein family protein [Sulfuricurvum sp.]
MKRIALFITIVVLFTGCSTVRPPIKEYTLLPSYTPAHDSPASFNGTLKLSSTRSIASLASTQFYYLKEDSSINAYLYSKWSDTPSSMIDRSVTSSLQKEQLFETLIPPTSSATADLILESDLNAFYHRFHNGSTSEGFINITYRLINPKTKITIASKHFTIIEPSPSSDAKGGVIALGNATHNLSEQCASWLTLILKENKWIK